MGWAEPQAGVARYNSSCSTRYRGRKSLGRKWIAFSKARHFILHPCSGGCWVPGRKGLLGEADQLNEYAIGVDSFGKPPTYDPRQDAIVRLHIGRIRQKLGEYYREEGKDDPVVIELPKGRFKLKWEIRSKPALEFPELWKRPKRSRRVLVSRGGRRRWFYG